MKQIKLTQGQIALVDDEDFEWLNSFKWCATRDGSRFYAVRSVIINGKRTTQQMHKLIMGDDSLKLLIDHKDRNGCNNQKENLRFCTSSENNMNKISRKNSSSIYKGVDWYRRDKKWRASIRVGGKLIHLGYFVIEEDAARAYDVAAIKHFKDFKKLNFN